MWMGSPIPKQLLNLLCIVYILGRIGLYFGGIWGEAELFLGIWGAKANTFRETRTLFAGRRRDQCIIFRDQGSTDPPPIPPPGAHYSNQSGWGMLAYLNRQ